MLMAPEENPQQVLERELDVLKVDNADRLCSILRGFHACMKDIDSRLQILEEKLGSEAND